MKYFGLKLNQSLGICLVHFKLTGRKKSKPFCDGVGSGAIDKACVGGGMHPLDGIDGKASCADAPWLPMFSPISGKKLDLNLSPAIMFAADDNATIPQLSPNSGFIRKSFL